MTEDLIVKVTMADLNVVKETGSLRTTGLGSCVGVTIFDNKTKVAGMAHIMLPSSEIARQGDFNVAKYADTAIPLLIQKMIGLGASKHRMQAKMAGGAQMFAFSSNSDTMRIGPRNVETCKKMLDQFSVSILAEDTGGNYGRTIEIDCQTGHLMVRSVQYGVKYI